jgi:hypothetical protein
VVTGFLVVGLVVVRRVVVLVVGGVVVLVVPFVFNLNNE